MTNDTYTPAPTVSQPWLMFTGFSFIVALAMMAGGIWNMEASFAAKGFYAMAAIMLVHTTVTITKTVRDHEEQKRLMNRLDEARTERLLMETKDADLL